MNHKFKILKTMLICLLTTAITLSNNIQPVMADDEWKTASLYGTAYASCSTGRNSSGSRRSSSGSATCYADIENAVGSIVITVGGDVSNSCSKGGGSYSASASFNGLSASLSGSTIVINAGTTPASGTVTIYISCSAYNSCDDGDTTSASVAVYSVKYKESPKPKFNSNLPPVNRHPFLSVSLPFSLFSFTDYFSSMFSSWHIPPRTRAILLVFFVSI